MVVGFVTWVFWVCRLVALSCKLEIRDPASGFLVATLDVDSKDQNLNPISSHSSCVGQPLNLSMPGRCQEDECDYE